MDCPYCGSPNVVPNVTIRWSQVRGVFVPRRGAYCTSCGKAFEGRGGGELALRSVLIERITPAIRSLQESGDLIVIRHRNGTLELVY